MEPHPGSSEGADGLRKAKVTFSMSTYQAQGAGSGFYGLHAPQARVCAKRARVTTACCPMRCTAGDGLAATPSPRRTMVGAMHKSGDISDDVANAAAALFAATVPKTEVLPDDPAARQAGRRGREAAAACLGKQWQQQRQLHQDTPPAHPAAVHPMPAVPCMRPRRQWQRCDARCWAWRLRQHTPTPAAAAAAAAATRPAALPPPHPCQQQSWPQQPPPPPRLPPPPRPRLLPAQRPRRQLLQLARAAPQTGAVPARQQPLRQQPQQQRPGPQGTPDLAQGSCCRREGPACSGRGTRMGAFPSRRRGWRSRTCRRARASPSSWRPPGCTPTAAARRHTPSPWCP